MRQPAGSLLKTDELFADFQQQHPMSAITRAQYFQILNAFFKGIVSLLLKGWRWNIGSRLGYIRIQQVKRSFKKPKINWHASRKLWAEVPGSHPTLVYFTDQPFWYCYYWEKVKCVVKNKAVYRFDPTVGPVGNSRKLAHLLNSDPFAALNFTH